MITDEMIDCIEDWKRDLIIDIALNFNHREINEYLMNRTKMEDHIIKFFFNNRDRYKIEDFLHKGQFEIECLIPVAEIMAEKIVICGCLCRSTFDEIFWKILHNKKFKSRELKQLRNEFHP